MRLASEHGNGVNSSVDRRGSRGRNTLGDCIPATAAEPLSDLRFRALLGHEAWAELPAPVQRRFSKRVANGTAVVYRGSVVDIRYSRFGYCLAQLLRPLGSPLPLGRERGAATVVTVTEDAASGGQVWSRLFARRGHFPHVIHSVKRFAGPTGLEEALGFGIVMALTLSVRHGRLEFASAGYALRLGRWRLPLPAALSPGRLLVTHTSLGTDRFRFALTLDHPWFGTLLHQEADYCEKQE